MKVGDLVRCYQTDDFGLIVGLIRAFPRQVAVRWNQTTETELFDWDEFEDLSYNRLEVISESR